MSVDKFVDLPEEDWLNARGLAWAIASALHPAPKEESWSFGLYKVFLDRSGAEAASLAHAYEVTEDDLHLFDEFCKEQGLPVLTAQMMGAHAADDAWLPYKLALASNAWQQHWTLKQINKQRTQRTAGLRQAEIAEKHYSAICTMVNAGQLDAIDEHNAPLQESMPGMRLSRASAARYLERCGLVSAGLERSARPNQTAEERRDARWRACVDAGLNMPTDTYGPLPRGIGKVAEALGITRQSLADDLNARREQKFGR